MPDRYKYDRAPLSAPWQQHMVTFATDQSTGERFASVAFFCDLTGLNIDTQTRALRKATEASLSSQDDGGPRFALGPDTLRLISMPPREDAKARAGYRDQLCILHTEVGWWLSHIPPHKIKDVEIRTNIEMFQRAVKAAADRLFWRTDPQLLTPYTERRLLTSVTVTCVHEGQCPCCRQWIRATGRGGETEWEHLA
jgi:hypothetical protein